VGPPGDPPPPSAAHCVHHAHTDAEGPWCVCPCIRVLTHVLVFLDACGHACLCVRVFVCVACRVADVAAGGNGAPLTSTMDALLMAPDNLPLSAPATHVPGGSVRWRAVQNIGAHRACACWLPVSCPTLTPTRSTPPATSCPPRPQRAMRTHPPRWSRGHFVQVVLGT
jgi:hypothetical protein